MQSLIKKFITLYLVLISIASARIYKPMEDLNQLYWQEIQGKSASEIQKLSLKQYQDFIALNVNSYELNPRYNLDSKKQIFLSVAKAQRALGAANKNPIVGLHMSSKYDPYNKGIGFCFGPAMFLDLYLSINGLNRGSIKKAFVVGPMNNGASWAWHVTTIVQSMNGPNEVWLAIDPIMNRVMEVTEWYKETLKISTDGKLRLYISESGKFAFTSSYYAEGVMSDKFYNDYFTDMMKWFDTNDVSGALGLQ